MYYGYTAQELIKETPIVEGFNYSSYLTQLNEQTEQEIEYGIIDQVVWITNL